MRLFVVLTALLLTLSPAVSAAGPRTVAGSDVTGRQVINGREFQDLAAWARANSLRWDWDGHSRALRATNRSVRLNFTLSARQIELNGVTVWLSIPITPYRGRVYVATLDVRTALQPLLQPARGKPNQKLSVIALDAGHGGRQPGNQVGDRLEKTYTLLLARKVRSLLREAGFSVVMTRDSDVFVDLPERPAIARRKGADLFVSLHYNSVASGAESARGIEVYCLTPAGVPSTNSRADEVAATQASPGNFNNSRNVLLAFQVQRALVKNLRPTDRGVRRARFSVLRTAEMPAILIEGGFMCDPEDAKDIFDSAGQAQLARAIVDGVLAYRRLVER